MSVLLEHMYRDDTLKAQFSIMLNIITTLLNSHFNLYGFVLLLLQGLLILILHIIANPKVMLLHSATVTTYQ